MDCWNYLKQIANSGWMWSWLCNLIFIWKAWHVLPPDHWIVIFITSITDIRFAQNAGDKKSNFNWEHTQRGGDQLRECWLHLNVQLKKIHDSPLFFSSFPVETCWQWVHSFSSWLTTNARPFITTQIKSTDLSKMICCSPMRLTKIIIIAQVPRRIPRQIIQSQLQVLPVAS